MPKAATPKRNVIGLRVDDELRAKLDEHVAATGRPLAQVVEEVLRRELLDGAASVPKRLAHIEQVIARLDGRHRADVRVLKELVGGFVYLFLLHFPALPEQTKDAAHMQASKRMADFIEFVTGSLKAGTSVLRPEDGEAMPDGVNTEEMETPVEEAA